MGSRPITTAYRSTTVSDRIPNHKLAAAAKAAAREARKAAARIRAAFDTASPYARTRMERVVSRAQLDAALADVEAERAACNAYAARFQWSEAREKQEAAGRDSTTIRELAYEIRSIQQDDANDAERAERAAEGVWM